MTFDEWRNEAKKLMFVDRHQVPFLGDYRWQDFRDNPIGFILNQRNWDVAGRIWDIANGND